MTFTISPPAIWHLFYTKMAETVVATKASPVRDGLPATFSERARQTLLGEIDNTPRHRSDEKVRSNARNLKTLA